MSAQKWAVSTVMQKWNSTNNGGVQPQVAQKGLDNTVGSGLTQEQKDLILGTLLGDGSMEKRWKNPRLRIDHSEAQKEYVLWKYSLLQAIATREPHSTRQTDFRSGTVTVHWYFTTKATPELDFFYRLFYCEGKKRIRKDIVSHFRNPLSLAVWLMDDGYKRNDCNALRFSTDCFSYEEQKILQYCFQENFGISSKLHKKGSAWNIYIPSGEMDRMRKLIHSFLIPSMNYKLPPRNDLV